MDFPSIGEYTARYFGNRFATVGAGGDWSGQFILSKTLRVFRRPKMLRKSQEVGCDIQRSWRYIANSRDIQRASIHIVRMDF